MDSDVKNEIGKKLTILNKHLKIEKYNVLFLIYLNKGIILIYLILSNFINF